MNLLEKEQIEINLLVGMRSELTVSFLYNIDILMDRRLVKLRSFGFPHLLSALRKMQIDTDNLFLSAKECNSITQFLSRVDCLSPMLIEMQSIISLSFNKWEWELSLNNN